LRRTTHHARRTPRALLALCALLALGAQGFAQCDPPEPATALDYYLLLPARFLSNYPVGETRQEREAAISLRDLQNGYIRLGTPGEGESATVVLFRKPDGSYLVAVESSLCALKCEQSLHLLRYENGQWSDETKTLLPAVNDRAARARVARETKAAKVIGSDNYSYQLIYQLPRYGTTINVTENWSNKKVAELQWSDGRFTVRQQRGR
jgi:hypothetical protein